MDYTKELSTQLGKHIKALRLMRGWTQEDLAYYASLNTTFISRIELGKASPSLLSLLKISRAFGFKNPNSLYQDIVNHVYKAMLDEHKE